MAVPVTPLAGEKIARFAAMLGQKEQAPLARFGAVGYVLKAMYADSVQAVKNFHVRDDDVYIVTPRKCGTTWTQEMVWLLMNNLDFETAMKTNLLQRSPYLEVARLVPDDVKKEILKNVDMVENSDHLPSPRCIKSHLTKELLPVQLWTKKPKIIYVAREPKDTAVSFFYHEQLFTSFSGDRDFFFECFYEDIVAYTPLWEHMLDFWKMKDEPNILFNTYEEMKKDLPDVIRRTAKFLGKSITEEQVARLAEHLDFKQMKQNRAVNLEDTLAKIGRTRDDKGEKGFIRKGVVGEGRREMSPEMVARFDERTHRVFNEKVGGCPWKI
ncbi:hypothetical protein R5R35_011312 [Gryllus longicercus]|uniref:Sulfotransferase domain-containing protein n=1 Tax=Gryllus longicercus TaxID=2509291 RepID=A0AAN9W571_9ORTH